MSAAAYVFVGFVAGFVAAFFAFMNVAAESARGATTRALEKGQEMARNAK
jgi:hypothetical protein